MKEQVKNKDFVNKLVLNGARKVARELIATTPNASYVWQVNEVQKDLFDRMLTKYQGRAVFAVMPTTSDVIQGFLDKLIAEYQDRVFIEVRYYKDDYSRYVDMLARSKFISSKAMTKALHDGPDIAAGIMLGFSFERYVIAKAMADKAPAEYLSSIMYDGSAVSKLAKKLNVAPSTLYRTQGEPSTYLKDKIDNLAKQDEFYSCVKDVYNYMNDFNK